MTRRSKILLGILAFFPGCYLVFFIVTVMLITFGMVTLTALANSSPTGEAEFDPIAVLVGFLVLFGLHFLAILVTIAQIVVYIVMVFRNPRLRDNDRLAWLLAIVLAGPIGAPIYWYRQVWKAPEQSPPPT